MDITTVSSKYQIVIPRKVRDQLGLKVGQKVQVLPYEGRIEIIPIESIKKSKGFLKGIDTKIMREKDRL
jgi:AbrB family looped-hinge helix DNA binding protein